MANKKIIILHDEIPAGAPADEKDTLAQVEAVNDSLQKQGYETVEMAATLDISDTMKRILQSKPFMVFNLVESLGGKSRLMNVIPALLEEHRIAYTGANDSALYSTTNKPLSKQLMLLSRIETPGWQTANELRKSGLKITAPVILKPVWEDASKNISDESVCATGEQLKDRMDAFAAAGMTEFFAEAFIDGREMNISLLSGNGRPEVLPPAEISFTDFPSGKPRIVNYDAKWNPDSFEFTHTPRRFAFTAEDKPLLEKVEKIAEKCWKLFGLRGYARVDFRIDKRNKPWVIEVNANPCLSRDSGFTAAAMTAGYTYEGIITRIVDDAYICHVVQRTAKTER